ncbi:hypothetical protein QL992_17720 [Microbacterium sp. APC 3898]|uniref:Uncharacterized protein n=1 Tax=Planococcus notacanthi TaxID=3035188 RepID=A0ABT7ZPT4_9BACL|nr:MULTISPECIES: hypothetical protein [Terrabacteria group]MDN3429161.1 hypothetical protein [Planococcus sp. APC 4016]MDN3501063.1 hypothetical protein [Microbacterium sp. APC 3898]
MKIYRGPIEADELIELAQDHEYGDTWITIIVPFDFRKLVDSPFTINFEEEISMTISPNDEALRNIEYRLVGFEEDDNVLVEITADTCDIIDVYNEEKEKNRRWFE